MSHQQNTRPTLPRSLPPCLHAAVASCDATKTAEGIELKHHQNGASLPFQEGEPFNLEFESRRLLETGDPTKPAYEVMLKWPSGDKSDIFSPGEAIGIVCPNDEAEVEKTLLLLGLTGVESVNVTPLGSDAAKKRFERQFQYVPEKCSARHLFSYVLDLRTVLKRVFLKILGDCCPEGSEDRRRLHEMSLSTGDYTKNVLEGRMMIFDILEIFPLCAPSLGVLIENLSRLGPRFYSVANYDSRRVRLLYRPMNFSSRNRTLLGLCSTYIEKMDVDSSGLKLGSVRVDDSVRDTSDAAKDSMKLRCFLRENIRNFAFPFDNRTPFVFICHGTGIAPMEAYLDRLEKADLNATECERWIFYGCRNMQKDDLLSQRKAEKLGFRLVVRQSRADPKRGYIQTAIPDHREDIIRVVKDSGGAVLICGDYNTMATQTLEALRGILGDGNEPDIVSNLMKQGRIKLDVWT